MTVGNLPIVVDSQGPKAPMTAAQVVANGTQLPYIPTGPYEEFPAKWHVSTENGALLDYVYVDVVANDNGLYRDGTWVYGDYKFLKPDGTWVKQGEKYSVTANKKGDVLYTIAIPKGHPALSDTKLKRDVTWNLIDSNLAEKQNGYHWQKTVTSGISNNVTVGLSYTLGMEAGLEGIAKVNQSLTASFGFGITLNSEESVTKTFDFNPKPDYPYDYFRTALYQQVATYSVAPGSGLQSWMSSWEKGDNERFNDEIGRQNAVKYKVKESVNYPVQVLLALTSK